MSDALVGLVDSHCHFHLLEEQPDTAVVVAKAMDAGVTHFLNVAVDVESRAQLLELSRPFDRISTSLGVHPSGTGDDPSADKLAELAADSAFVAVGETGLDYIYNRGDLDWQRERFRRHIRAALLIDKPLIVHSRGAPMDTVRILAEEGADRVGGVIHCFTEDWDTAQACMDLDFHLSLSGILTFRNAESLRATAARIPLERLLIETDSPYLAPVPHRGQENQPAWVGNVALCLAEVQQIDPATIARETARNFFEVFPLAVQPGN